MQSTSWEMLDWNKHKLESRLLGEISITSDMQMTPPLWRWWMWMWRRTKEPLEESERGEWKSWLKAQHSENESWHPVPSLHGKYMGETMETLTDFIFGAFTPIFNCHLHLYGPQMCISSLGPALGLWPVHFPSDIPKGPQTCHTQGHILELSSQTQLSS